MDPLSLILAALVAGTSAALQDTASDAVKDGYAKLKDLLKSKFKGNDVAEAKLEELEQEANADITDLKPHLAAVGAERDTELLEAARVLMERVDPQGAQKGKYHVTVSGAQGLIIGDHASPTMTFDNRRLQ